MARVGYEIRFGWDRCQGFVEVPATGTPITLLSLQFKRSGEIGYAIDAPKAKVFKNRQELVTALLPLLTAESAKRGAPEAASS